MAEQKEKSSRLSLGHVVKLGKAGSSRRFSTCLSKTLFKLV